MPLAFASALSTNPNSLAALDEVVALALEQLQGTPTLALLFVSANHIAAAEKIAPRLCEQLGTENVIGCSGESIVGVGTEIEMASAMSLWVAALTRHDRVADATRVCAHRGRRFDRWLAG